MSGSTKEKTVSRMVKEQLCTGCGVCSAVCPLAAISMEKKENGYYEPVIGDGCVQCGKCLAVCSGMSAASYQAENLSLEDCRTDRVCFSAHSKDEALRHNASSGAVATELIRSLLEQGVYEDARVVASQDAGEVQKTVSYRSSESSCTQKSRYLPVSQEETAQEMRRNPEKRLILVATPCCTASLLNMIEMFGLERENYLFVGLFCDGTLSYNALEYFKFLAARNGSAKEVGNVLFRDKDSGGWPGNVGIVYRDGTKEHLPRTERMMIKKFFELERCRYCTMKLNPLSDIALGDDYIPGEKTKEGDSSVILYTKRGREAFERVRPKLEVSASDYEAVYRSQKTGKKKITLQYQRIKEEHSKDAFHFPGSAGKGRVCLRARAAFRFYETCSALGEARRYQKIYGRTRAEKLVRRLKNRAGDRKSVV